MKLFFDVEFEKMNSDSVGNEPASLVSDTLVPAFSN